MKNVCLGLLLIMAISQLVGQDTLRRYIIDLEYDSLKYQWLGDEINKAWMSDPEYASRLSQEYELLANSSQDVMRHAEALNYNGVAAYANGEYEVAANYYLQALSILEGSERYELLGYVLNNLASCYAFRKDNTKSIEYYLQALGVAQKAKDSTRLALLNNNLGIQYVAIKDYNSAEQYYNQAIGLYERFDQPLYVGITLLSKANLLVEQEKYDDAISNYNRAMLLVSEKVVPLLHAASYAGIGSAHNRMRRYRAGEEFLLASLEKATAIDHIEQIKESHRELSDLYENIGRHAKSLFHFKEYTLAKDSLFTIKQDETLMNALTKYESEKKQQENIILKAQNEVNELRLDASRKRGVFFGLGLLGLTGFSIMLFRFNGRINSQNKIISKALSEKETLLQEIHHRVKNNLQFISSLLRLQSEHIEDEKALGALQEGQDRVQSMALIHQHLYQEDNLKGVDMKDYFTKLIRGLFETYNIRKDQVLLQLNIEDLNLDIDTVVPVGLIVNELVSNSLKYAFPNSRKGMITVDLLECDEKLLISVADDGLGINQETQATLGESFGYRLIHVLKDQMKADLEIDVSQGTRVTIRIKKYAKA